MRHILSWNDCDQPIQREWITESALSPPTKILLADDTLTANTFYRAATQGSAFIWKGDFQNAKQLLHAIQRRIDKKLKSADGSRPSSPTEAFHKHRQMQAHRAQLLARLLLLIQPDLTIALRRAPDVRLAISEALETPPQEFAVSLRDLLGLIGAHEWRKKGVYVPALDAKIHPHYGLFSPVRGEYLELLAKAPLSEGVDVAFDIGTGTGVIASLLAKRGIPKIVATDLDPRAIVCATENISRLGFDRQIELVKADLFPTGQADLIVCNPPWIPARPTSPLERAIYDEDSRMLRNFLNGVHAHLSEHGEAWLILSDLAEHLGLRQPQDVPSWIQKAGLQVISTLETQPRHPKSRDTEDPLHEARSREITRLWRLKVISK